MNQKKILACNWKMNPTSKEELKNLLDVYRDILAEGFNQELVAIPPSIYLDFVMENSNLSVGAQDLAIEQKGAFTSQISAEMLVDLGCKYTLVGHSETRQYFGYTDEIISRKFESALIHNLNVILCVGHSQDKSKPEINTQEIINQLNSCIFKIKDGGFDLSKVVIAYEPVWAIGTGVVPTQAQIREVTSLIKNYLTETLGAEMAANIRVLYGGSVNGSNAAELNQIENLDGFLVGGASLKAVEIIAISKSFN